MKQIEEKKRKKEALRLEKKRQDEMDEARIQKEREEIERRRAESRYKRENKINQVLEQPIHPHLEPARVLIDLCKNNSFLDFRDIKILIIFLILYQF